LVDWHVAIEAEAVSYVYIRTRTPTVVERKSLLDESALRVEVFEQLLGRRPNPNIPALDDALIKTISDWKRSLAAELGQELPIRSLSALFNGILFVRALEDQRRRLAPNLEQVVLDTWITNPTTLARLLRSVAGRFVEQIPTYLLDERALRAFDGLDRDTVRVLLSDFYANRYAPYRYDFSVISQHALSRIYEHYVSLLRDIPTSQLSLLPALPIETTQQRAGAVYTPQFVARFFARYLREQIPLFAFRRLQAIDPACGSGIFLRTLLELQCDPALEQAHRDGLREAFQRAHGLDVDENAAKRHHGSRA
jgi:hypothetical protein